MFYSPNNPKRDHSSSKIYADFMRAVNSRKKILMTKVIIGDQEFESIDLACKKLEISRAMLTKLRKENKTLNGHKIIFQKTYPKRINKVK